MNKQQTRNDSPFPFTFPIEIPMNREPQIHSFTQTIVVRVHNFYISKEIGDVDAYIDLLNTLKTAEAHDTIFLYINSPGGNLQTALQIVNGIKFTQATVVTVMDGYVASAATLIFLAGNKHLVFPDGAFMIHTMSYGTGGKSHEVNSHVEFSNKWWKGICDTHYQDFLTTEELHNVVNGRDLWMTSEEISVRLTENDNGLMTEPVTLENLSEKIPEFIENYLKSKETGSLIPELESVPELELDLATLEELIIEKPAKKPRKKASPKKK